jgi:hypothetical protein
MFEEPGGAPGAAHGAAPQKHGFSSARYHCGLLARAAQKVSRVFSETASGAIVFKGCGAEDPRELKPALH